MLVKSINVLSILHVVWAKSLSAYKPDPQINCVISLWNRQFYIHYPSGYALEIMNNISKYITLFLLQASIILLCREQSVGIR